MPPLAVIHHADKPPTPHRRRHTGPWDLPPSSPIPYQHWRLHAPGRHAPFLGVDRHPSRGLSTPMDINAGERERAQHSAPVAPVPSSPVIAGGPPPAPYFHARGLRIRPRGVPAHTVRGRGGRGGSRPPPGPQIRYRNMSKVWQHADATGTAEHSLPAGDNVDPAVFVGEGASAEERLRALLDYYARLGTWSVDEVGTEEVMPQHSRQRYAGSEVVDGAAVARAPSIFTASTGTGMDQMLEDAFDELGIMQLTETDWTVLDDESHVQELDELFDLSPSTNPSELRAADDGPHMEGLEMWMEDSILPPTASPEADVDARRGYAFSPPAHQQSHPPDMPDLGDP
jgi:hypothetical protein